MNKDYKKLYEEALEKGRKIHRFSSNPTTIKNMEDIFPELRESDGERARKELLEFLNSIWHLGKKADFNRFSKADCANWIAWLEKQKEIKTEDLGEFINELSKQFPEISFAKLSRIAVRVKNWIEKQGEQKPVDYYCYKIDEMVAEYQNNPEQGTDFGKPVLCMVRAYRQGIENAIQKFGLQKPVEDGCKNSDDITTEEKDMTEYKKGFECGKQRVLKYPEDFSLCKKPSWGEDDERMIDTIIYDLERHGGKEDSSYSSEINWLKSLKDRVQPKQEWSEEDKRRFEYCKRLVYASDKYSIEDREETVDWLKSIKPQPKYQWTDEDENNLKDLLAYGETKLGLRRWIAGLPEKLGSRSEYHWKPSEEQLNALKQCIGGYYSEEADKKLEALYEDIKNL